MCPYELTNELEMNWKKYFLTLEVRTGILVGNLKWTRLGLHGILGGFMKRMNTHFTLFTHTNYDDFHEKIKEQGRRARF